MTFLENRTSVALACAVVSCIGGCMSVAAPEHARTDAEQTVRTAEALGSDDSPGAAYQLALARYELGEADRLVRLGEMGWASEYFERAKADADLAIALRREDEARSAALRTHAELDQLHDEEQGTTGDTLPAAPITPAPSVGTTPSH